MFEQGIASFERMQAELNMAVNMLPFTKVKWWHMGRTNSS